MMPRNNAYGTWPASGEIDIMESRGNLNLVQGGVNIGSEQVGSTLHFGPNWAFNGFQRAHFSKNTAAGAGYDKDFHTYGFEWTPGNALLKLYYIFIGENWYKRNTEAVAVLGAPYQKLRNIFK